MIEKKSKRRVLIHRMIRDKFFCLTRKVMIIMKNTDLIKTQSKIMRTELRAIFSVRESCSNKRR